MRALLFLVFAAHAHPVVSEVYVNGHGPYRFLLDTGAQSCTLRPSIAASIGLRPEYRVHVDTLAGSVLAAAAPKARLSAGGVHAAAEVVFSDVPLGLDGVLGQSFLSHFRLYIDNDRRSALFNSAPPAGARILLSSSDGSWSLPVALPGRTENLVLDSGASNIVLFHAAAGTPATLGTSLGVRASTQRPLNWLIVGPHRLRRLSGVYLDAPGRSAGGLLPTSVFRTVYIDPLAGFAILQPR